MELRRWIPNALTPYGKSVGYTFRHVQIMKYALSLVGRWNDQRLRRIQIIPEKDALGGRQRLGALRILARVINDTRWNDDVVVGGNVLHSVAISLVLHCCRNIVNASGRSSRPL